MRWETALQRPLVGWLLHKGSDRSSSVPIEVPATIPAGSSSGISPDFLGLAFEQSSFARYAEDDSGNINTFSTNLLKSIYSRTGGKPNIRLGGTSSDYGHYLPTQNTTALPVAEQDNYQDIGHTSIGPSYWSLTKNFPEAVYIVQVPLATRNISEPIAWVQSALNEISPSQLFSIQPGNEPDLYSNAFTGAGGIALHPPDYQGTLTSATYVGNWTAYVAAIKAAVPSVPAGRVFSAFDIASSHKDVFPVDTCFGLGIDAGGVIKEVASHYYQGNAGTAATLGSGLMNLTATHSSLDAFRVRIDWLRANRPEISFVLSEVGNSLQPTHTYEYQARLGSALWQVDFYLYSMAIGIARINYQQIMHAGYDLWLPVASAGLQPQVFANYYSQPFLADFIGKSGKLGKSGRTRVAQLQGNATNISAYAAYESGIPKRIAAVNMAYWNATSSATPRGSATLDFKVPKSVAQATVYRLTSLAGAGAAADSITYGGSQWTHASLGREVKGVRRDRGTLDVKDGVVRVTVADSEAVLVWL
ncbi:hypothetical protein F5Y03DRAFT_283903 [Xylaria venustula]|nr:hypothetical protein F5Y03DRAFT_283903 [Xylaria venustula]